MTTPPPIPRAPATREKLAAAEGVLAELGADVAALALEASEGKAGSERALASHRSKIEAAERQVSELRRAVALAERLDRRADAAGAAAMRAEQLVQFKSCLAAREKAMAKVLEAAAVMAKAYGEFSEATLGAANAIPSSTAVPVMSIGAEGFAGVAFGPCDRLVLAELYRFAPERKDTAGRFILPFAKPPGILTTLNPQGISPGIDALIAADRAIVENIEAQIARRNEAEQVAAKGIAA